ncbi:MAG: c-type cytochrome [Proteobacteria bacterium]|nr:c-type cytochrome [Pseudomonadota bacterium]
MLRRTIAIAAVAAALLIGSCGKEDQKSSEPPQRMAKPPAQPRKAGTPPEKKAPAPSKNNLAKQASDSPTMVEAKRLFKMQCAQCHGQSGRGDGMAAAALNPKPRNYTDKAWQKTVTDQEIRDIIVKGGAMVGKSPLMPANPALEKRPELVDALVALIRSFAE